MTEHDVTGSLHQDHRKLHMFLAQLFFLLSFPLCFHSPSPGLFFLFFFLAIFIQTPRVHIYICDYPRGKAHRAAPRHTALSARMQGLPPRCQRDFFLKKKKLSDVTCGNCCEVSRQRAFLNGIPSQRDAIHICLAQYNMSCQSNHRHRHPCILLIPPAYLFVLVYWQKIAYFSSLQQKSPPVPSPNFMCGGKPLPPPFVQKKKKKNRCKEKNCMLFRIRFSEFLTLKIEMGKSPEWVGIFYYGAYGS